MPDNKDTEDSIEQTDMLDQLSSDVFPKDVAAPAVKPDKSRRLTMKPPFTQSRQSDDIKSGDEGSHTGEPEDEDSFDTFILSNFEPFSGSEDVIEWLDSTDKTFNLCKVPRKSRYDAIPLLVTGGAKRTYLLNQERIKSYDDFYTVLLTQYDVSSTIVHHPNSRSFTPSVNHGTNTRDAPVPKNVVFDDQQKTTRKTFDMTDSSPQPPILRSTALHDLGTADTIGDVPVNRSHFLTTDNSLFNTSPLDQTTYALRRAIVDSLIKNPKTFRGGKEDVKQWLEDIDQLFDTAQIPEDLKLDLVQYSLRGEASRWFKNNKSTFTSWNSFVKGLKATFLSPFFEEIAFKKLESYSQGVNQPIRSFHNEVLKLCNEADPFMSDSSKLRYLLNKAKPSLQFEIRKKKPSTTKQFLEYAIEVEELFHLTNIDISHNFTSTTPTFPITSTITSPRQSNPSPNPDKAIPSSPDREANYNNTGNNNRNRNSNHNASRSSQPIVSSHPPFRSKYKPRNGWQPPSQPFASNQQGGYFNPNPHPSTIPSSPSHYSHQHTNHTPYNNNNQRTYFPPALQRNNPPNANLRSILDPLPFASPVVCSRCSQQGHHASECPHF